MTMITPQRRLIAIEGARFLGAVSEELIQRLGAMNNFLALYEYQEKNFQANGLYGRIQSFPEIASDGLTEILFNAEIVDAFFYIKEPGTGGVTEVDIKWAAPGSSVWTSIFTTTPKFSSTAAQNARVDAGGNNPATTGVTAPVLDPAQLNRNAGDAFRFDIISAMTGDPISVGGILFYRPR
jgi:hypothetical protein